jgi:hypothetical protein
MIRDTNIMLDTVAYRLREFNVVGSTCLVASALKWRLKFPPLDPEYEQEHCFRRNLLV